MSDLIDRQAAIDAISSMFAPTPTQEDMVEDCLEIIENLPSVQLEFVRCKDCKYMTEHYDTDGNAPYWTCSEWDAGTDYDGFCHYAERRTDETDSCVSARMRSALTLMQRFERTGDNH